MIIKGLKSLGQKEKVDTAVPVHAKKKTSIEYPEISVSSSQLTGVENAKLGQKCQLVFEAEVTELRQPSRWDIERGEGKTEVLARIRLLKGAYSQDAVGPKPKSISDAGHMIRDELLEKK